MDRPPKPHHPRIVARTATSAEPTLVGELAELGTELRDELAELRGDLTELGSELRDDVVELGRDMRVEAKAVKREFAVVLSELIDDQQRRRIGALLLNLSIAAGVAVAVLLATLN